MSGESIDPYDDFLFGPAWFAFRRHGTNIDPRFWVVSYGTAMDALKNFLAVVDDFGMLVEVGAHP